MINGELLSFILTWAFRGERKHPKPAKKFLLLMVFVLVGSHKKIDLLCYSTLRPLKVLAVRVADEDLAQLDTHIMVCIFRMKPLIAPKAQTRESPCEYVSERSIHKQTWLMNVRWVLFVEAVRLTRVLR